MSSLNSNVWDGTAPVPPTHTEHEQGWEYGQEGADANAGWSAASHVINDILSEFAALDLRRALHEAGEVVGHAFAGDGAV